MFIGILRIVSAITNIVGQGLGGAFDALFSKPAHWVLRSNPAFLLKWLIVGAVVYSILLGLKTTNLVDYIPSLPSQTTCYQAREAPAANIAESSEQLQALENVLAGLSLNTEQYRARIDNQARSHSDVSDRLGALESRLQKEGVRAAEDRNVDRTTANQGLTLRNLMPSEVPCPQSNNQNAQPRRVPQVMKRRAQSYWRWKNTLVALRVTCEKHLNSAGLRSRRVAALSLARHGGTRSHRQARRRRTSRPRTVRT